MEQLKKKITVATKWSFITEIVAKLITPITNMVLARILMPEDFGAIATITMIISFAEIFTDAGFQKYIIQHDFYDESELRKSIDVAFWSNFCLSILTVILIFCFRKIIAVWVGAPELEYGISVASISIVLISFSSIQMAVYRRKLDFKTLFYVRIIVSFIPLFVTVPLAFFLKNYWALIIGTMLSNIVQAVILTIKSSWHPKVYYSFKRLSEMLFYSFWTLLETISFWLTSYIGTFIVGKYLDSYYLGLYKTSMSTVNSYMNILTSSITTVLFSALSRYQDDNIQFQYVFLKFQRMFSILIMPMGVGLFVYSELITRIVLGGNWIIVSDFIGSWGFVSAISIAITYFASEVFRSKGRPDISLFNQLIHLVFLIPTIIFGAESSFETLCITRALIRCELIVTSLLFLQFLFGIPMTKVLKNILPQTISAILMGFAGWLMLQISDGMIWQFASVGVCIILYFVILMQFKNIKKEIFALEFVDKAMKRIKVRIKHDKKL